MLLIKLGEEFNKRAGIPVLGEVPTLAVVGARVAEELSEAMNETHSARFFEEMADVILTITSAAAAYGYPLDAELMRKHDANLKRSWDPHPTMKGCVKHRKPLKVRK